MDTWIVRVRQLLRPAEARPPARFRPGVEALETRCVPTVTFTTASGSHTSIPLGEQTSITFTADEFVDGDITDSMDLPFAYKIDWKDGSAASTGTLTVSGSNLTATVTHRFLKPLQQISFEEVEQGEGDKATETVNVKITFPTVAKIQADATVTSAENAVWAETKNFAQMHSGTDKLRREEAFWIELNSANGSYAVTATQYGKSVGPDERGGIDNVAIVHDNPGAHLFVVALFHTHTPTTYRTVGRPTGPSQEDTNAANKIMMPVLAYDYDVADAPPHYPLNSPAHVYSTGPNQRADTELMF